MSGVVYTGVRRKRIVAPPPDPRAVFGRALAQLKQTVRQRRKQSQRFAPPVPPQQRQRFLPVLNAIQTGERRLRPALALPPRILEAPRKFKKRVIGGLDRRRIYRVRFSYTILISGDAGDPNATTIPETKELPYEFRGTDDQLNDAILDYIADRWNPHGGQLIDLGDVVITDLNGERLDYRPAERMRLREPREALDVVNIFDNIVRLTQTDENCVKNVLREYYPEISKLKKDPIGKLGTADGVTVKEIKQFCADYKICMVAFDVKGKVMEQHVPDTKSHKHKNLAFLAYHDHIYPLKGKSVYFTKKDPDTKEVKLTEEEMQNTFDHLIHEERRVPSFVNLRDEMLTSFQDGNTMYFKNDAYDACKALLEEYDLLHKLKYDTTYADALRYIEQAHNEADYESFFPIQHVKTPLLYQAPHDARIPERTYDKNKCYSDAYSQLDELLVVDYRQSPVETENIENLMASALYVATPEYPNVLMHKKDIYWGALLIYAKKRGVKFTLQERIVCKRRPNPYKYIIPRLYSNIKDASIVKDAINKTIGAYQVYPQVKTTGKNAVVLTKDEVNPDLPHFPYGDRYIQYDPHKYVSGVRNRRPIAIQIKDKANILLYEFMMKYGLHTSHIIQIKTDSVSFDARAIKTVVKTETGLRGWKVGNYNMMNVTSNIHMGDITMKQRRFNHNTLITGYAGNGKSHHIRNNLDLTDSIILSSKHSALVQHRNDGLNADVIHKYEFTHTIPVEQHIIFEECGIATRSHWDLLFKCFLLGKKLTLFGDWNQLLPVGEKRPFNSQTFLDYMFEHHVFKNENWRNDFTSDYYDDLIGNRLELIAECRKHSTATPEDADIVVAHTNKHVDAYNIRMAEYHKIDYELTVKKEDAKTGGGRIVRVQAGVPIICDTNDLRDKDIYNNMIFQSEEIAPEDLKHFKLAYARTIYNLQGDEVKSYYLAPEDEQYFTQPRFAYTLISRLKTNVCREENARTRTSDT